MILHSLHPRESRQQPHQQHVDKKTREAVFMNAITKVGYYNNVKLPFIVSQVGKLS